MAPTEVLFKYKLGEILDNLSVSDYKKAMTLLPSIIDKDIQTIYNYRKIKIGESGDIPHAIVCDLERFFNLPPNGLQNYQSNITALADLKNIGAPPGEGGTLAKKLGLAQV